MNNHCLGMRTLGLAIPTLNRRILDWWRWYGENIGIDSLDSPFSWQKKIHGRNNYFILTKLFYLKFSHFAYPTRNTLPTQNI